MKVVKDSWRITKAYSYNHYWTLKAYDLLFEIKSHR